MYVYENLPDSEGFLRSCQSQKYTTLVISAEEDHKKARGETPQMHDPDEAMCNRQQEKLIW